MTPEPQPTASEALVRALPEIERQTAEYAESGRGGGPFHEYMADAILSALASEGFTLVPEGTVTALRDSLEVIVRRLQMAGFLPATREYLTDVLTDSALAAAAERERIAAPYIEALENLLEDTQHSEHHCSDPECPVGAARKLLDSRSTTGGAE